MMKPIELRDISNTSIYTTQIDITGTYPEVIQFDGKPYILKNVSKGSGVGTYRETAILDLGTPAAEPA